MKDDFRKLILAGNGVGMEILQESDEIVAVVFQREIQTRDSVRMVERSFFCLVEHQIATITMGSGLIEAIVVEPQKILESANATVRAFSTSTRSNSGAGFPVVQKDCM